MKLFYPGGFGRLSNGTIIPLDIVTEGAACTTLMALPYINNSKPLVIANCDQYLEWDFDDYLEHSKDRDGSLVVFNSTNPHHSYAKVKKGQVVEVAEKKVISDNATVGLYYWRNGFEYVKYAEQMIEKNIRTNNEFYTCPTFNEAIGDGKKIKTFNIDKMWGLGTPEDLNYYLENKK